MYEPSASVCASASSAVLFATDSSGTKSSVTSPMPMMSPGWSLARSPIGTPSPLTVVAMERPSPTPRTFPLLWWRVSHT